jgi:ABC-type Fe3+ transport system substrate-binding protein
MQRRQFLQLAAVSAVANEVRAEEQSSTVTVLTSFPDAMLMRFEKAFSVAHPGVRLVMLWRTGPDALAYLHGAGRDIVDVYWAPSMHNFHTLAAEGAFSELRVDRDSLPGWVGRQPQSDAHGRFEAVETAGFAIVANARYLERHDLEMPERFADLADAKYAQHLALPVPSRIGFAPPIYEHWLQASGWRPGFEMIARLVANAQLVSSGGTGVVDRVSRGRSGLGLTMDFFAINAAAQGAPVTLRYPLDTLFSPAHVAILAATRRPQAARLFADFVLSPEGQRLLLDPSIARLPMRPAAYRSAPVGLINPFSVGDMANAHDIQRGLRRQPVVNALFDAAFANQHEQLCVLWKRLRDTERAHGTAQDHVKQARALATAMPIAEDEADDPALARQLSERSPKRSALIERWQQFFAQNYAQALNLIEAAQLT